MGAMPHPQATSRDFVETENLLALARVAETFHCRPSELLGFSAAGSAPESARSFTANLARRSSPTLDATTALQIDIVAAVSLWLWRQKVTSSESDAQEEWW
jgi:hypothetical protein